MCLKLVRCVLLLDDPGSSVIFLGENPSFAKAFVKSADGFVQKWRIERNFWWPSNNRNHDQQQLDGGNSRIFFSRLCNESNIGPRSQVTSYPHVLWQTRKKKSTEQFVASLSTFTLRGIRADLKRKSRWCRGEKRLLTDKRLNPGQMADSRLSCISIRYLQLKMLDTCTFCDRSPKD